VKINVGGLPGDVVRTLFRSVMSGLSSNKLRLCGVRTDPSVFTKLGIKQDTRCFGLFHNIPVVMTPLADFDTMEFVFCPER
jgi:hypothetical protein